MQSISPRVFNALNKQSPEITKHIATVVNDAYREHSVVRQAFDDLLDSCQSSRNAPIQLSAIEEMLVQHLLTERFFRLIFQDTTVMAHNPIAMKMEALLAVLPLDRAALLGPFEETLSAFAREVSTFSWPEKRQALSTLYEHLLHTFSKQQTNTYGIVYTPPEVVRFMCQSVSFILSSHFQLSLADPRVKTLDPCTETGSFILTLMDLITETEAFETQYRESLFCNEILLYPYYLASLLIEQEHILPEPLHVE